jgi:hypothetical protein
LANIGAPAFQAIPIGRRDDRVIIPIVRFGAIILIFSLTAAGCAHQQRATAPSTQPTVVYIDQPVVALAYAPPVAQGNGYGSLDRAGRQPQAFVGYETLVTEYFWLRTDDRFRFYTSGGGRSGSGHGSGFGSTANDRYERRAVSTRIGVLDR